MHALLDKELETEKIVGHELFELAERAAVGMRGNGSPSIAQDQTRVLTRCDGSGRHLAVKYRELTGDLHAIKAIVNHPQRPS